MEQFNKNESSREREEDVVDEQTARELGATAERLEEIEEIDQDVEDLLAEIDDVLEEDAEEFVGAFVQKGGQ